MVVPDKRARKALSRASADPGPVTTGHCLEPEISPISGSGLRRTFALSRKRFGFVAGSGEGGAEFDERGPVFMGPRLRGDDDGSSHVSAPFRFALSDPR